MTQITLRMKRVITRDASSNANKFENLDKTNS